MAENDKPTRPRAISPAMVLSPPTAQLHDLVEAQLPPEEEWAEQKTFAEDTAIYRLPPGCDLEKNAYFTIPDKKTAVVEWREGQHTGGIPVQLVTRANHPDLTANHIDEVRGCVFIPSQNAVMVFMPRQLYDQYRKRQAERLVAPLGKPPKEGPGFQPPTENEPMATERKVLAPRAAPVGVTHSVTAQREPLVGAKSD